MKIMMLVLAGLLSMNSSLFADQKILKVGGSYTIRSIVAEPTGFFTILFDSEKKIHA